MPDNCSAYNPVAPPEAYKEFFSSLVWKDISSFVSEAYQIQLATLMRPGLDPAKTEFLRGSLESLNAILSWPKTLVKETPDA